MLDGLEFVPPGPPQRSTSDIHIWALKGASCVNLAEVSFSSSIYLTLLVAMHPPKNNHGGPVSFSCSWKILASKLSSLSCQVLTFILTSHQRTLQSSCTSRDWLFSTSFMQRSNFNFPLKITHFLTKWTVGCMHMFLTKC
jgi:hypothetical protein